MPPAPEARGHGAVDEQPTLTLVVPTYNEGSRLSQGLDRLGRAASEGALDLEETELVVVDDGSTDDTLASANATSEPVAARIPVRTDAGRVFNLAVRLVGGVHLADTQCGFKGFRRGAALLLAQLQTTQGYAFDVELLWLAQRLSLDLEVVPVTWLDVPGSTVRVVRDSTRMLADLLASRSRHRFVAIADLDGSSPEHAPRGTVVLRSHAESLLCGAVSDLGAIRRVVGPTGHARLCSLAELAARTPFELEPAC